jgi:hypothetical protein
MSLKSIHSRLSRFEARRGASRNGLLIIVEGGLPDQPPITEEMKANAHAELRGKRNAIIVLGGLPESPRLRGEPDCKWSRQVPPPFT